MTNGKVMPEDILKVINGSAYTPAARRNYFEQIYRASRGYDSDPSMILAVSGEDIREEGLPTRPRLILGFTTRNLLDWMLDHQIEAHKSIKAAARYGYMGASRSTGGVNGVLKLGNSDGDAELLAQLKKAERVLRVNDKLLDYGFSNPDGAEPVKIVAHIPSGDRILGYMQKESQPGDYDLRALFVAVGNYRR